MLLHSAKRFTWAAWGLAGYFLSVPVFLLFNILPHQTFSLIISGFLTACAFAVLISIAFKLRKYFFYDKLSPIFLQMIIIVLFVTSFFDFWNLLQKFEYPPKSVEFSADWISVKNPNKNLPNVYHLLFDGYQSELFLESLKEYDTEDKLQGFTFFPNNYSIFRKTKRSLRAIFSSARPTSFSSSEKYDKAAFRAKGLVYGLKKHGYKTICLNCLKTHHTDPNSEFGFDLRTRLQVKADKSLEDHSFYQFWAESYLPGIFLSSLSLDPIDPNTIDFKLRKSRPIRHFQAFKKYLQDERLLPEKNRYTHLHLLVPHDPFVLDSNCQFNKGLPKTTRLAQGHCAFKMIDQFITRLKDLGRYENSLIMIHADHGLGIKEFGAELRAKELLSHMSGDDLTAAIRKLNLRRASLLVKSPNTLSEFAIDEKLTSILDIAPTIYGAIGAPIPEHFEGIDVFSRDHSVKPFVIFEERKDNAAFLIENGRMTPKGDRTSGYESL